MPVHFTPCIECDNCGETAFLDLSDRETTEQKLIAAGWTFTNGLKTYCKFCSEKRKRIEENEPNY